MDGSGVGQLLDGPAHRALPRLQQPLVDAHRMVSMPALQFLYLLPPLVGFQADAAVVLPQSQFEREHLLDFLSAESLCDAHPSSATITNSVHDAFKVGGDCVGEVADEQHSDLLHYGILELLDPTPEDVPHPEPNL